MDFIKNHKTLAVFASLSLIFLVSRIFSLTNLPIFTDEAIYIRWAQIAFNDPNWLFISLTDGKQPLFIWLIVLAMHFTPDPLLAGRIVSVLSGFLSIVGLYYLSMELFKNQKIAFISALTYVIYPFALVYDRMALYDSLVGAFAIWGIYLVIRLVRKPSLFLGVLLGIEVGLSNINKSNLFQTIFLSFPTVLLFNFGKTKFPERIVKPLIFIFFAGIISFAIYSLLRVSPFFYIINQKNGVFLYPFSEWLANPFLSFFGNLKALLVWFYNYTTLPLIALMFISLIDKKFIKEKMTLILWFIAPLLALSFLGRVIYPRYILFMALPLLPLVSYSIYRIFEVVKNKYLATALVVTLLILPLKSDFYILTNFSKSDVPLTDKFQYDIGWPSGWGIREAVSFFEEESQKGKIFVGTQGTFGLLPQTLDIYLGRNKNVTTKGYWPIQDQIPQELVEKSKIMPTYVVYYQPCTSCKSTGVPPSQWPLKQILSVKRGEGVNFGVYQVESIQ